MVAGNNQDDAFNGISSQSRVNTISATVGNSLTDNPVILLNNFGDLTVNQASLNTGRIRVSNQVGFLTIDDISLTGTSADNRVFVSTANSDIAVGRIDAGGGVVTIDSADDIFDTDFQDDLFVSGEFLSVTSRNGNVDAFDGVILNVDVDQFVADVQGGGSEFIRQIG